MPIGGSRKQAPDSCGRRRANHLLPSSSGVPEAVCADSVGWSSPGSLGPALIADAPGANQQLALDDVNVYWATENATGSSGTWHHTINAVPKMGGSVTVVSDGPGAFVNGLIARGESVYWSVDICFD